MSGGEVGHGMKARLYAACAAVVLAYAAGWLMASDNSPLHEYFLFHVTLPNAWRAANLLPVIVAAVAAGNPHSWDERVFHVAFAAQWFAVGYLVAPLASTLRSWFWKPR